MRIYDVVDNDDFCWGSWIVKSGAPANVAIESVLLVYEYAFDTLGFTKAHFDVRKDNAKVRAFHKRFGAKEVGESDKDFIGFLGRIMKRLRGNMVESYTTKSSV